MEILERQIKFIYPEKRAERLAHGHEIDAIEAKYGFPPNRQYMTFVGSDEAGTLVLEREWPSMAAWEEALSKANQDPEYQKLIKKFGEWQREMRFEIYLVVKR